MRILKAVLPILLASSLSFASAKYLNLTDLDTTLMNETLFSPLYNSTVEWGVYKPNLYFGIKNREEFPLSIGMFWVLPNNSTDGTDNTQIRHQYVMDSGVVGHYDFNDATCSSR